MARGIFGSITNGEYKLNDWIKHLNDGKFNGFCRTTLCEMGGYDWWGTDKSFYNKIMKDLVGKVVELSKSNKIDGEKTYVFFKENCPCIGPTYVSFSFCDIEKNNVLYYIGHLKKGCYGKDFSGWEIFDNTDIENPKTIRGNWKFVKEYFNV